MGAETNESLLVTEPIVILGTPRSVSSMTAGIFAKHGVWVGDSIKANTHNVKGFFENVAIRNVVRRMQKCQPALEGRVAREIPGFKDAVLSVIARQGYVDGAWLYKGSALQWPAFYEFHPKWVCCRRPVEQIFNSCRSSRIFGTRFSDARLREIISMHYDEMDVIEDKTWVDTYEVAQGNYSSIELALESCGIEPDREKIDSFVDKSLWRHK